MSAQGPVAHSVRVQLRWSDGRTEMLPERIDWMKSELMHPDDDGKMHRFKDTEQHDSDGFHIFAQSD
jgi:hypothetical protein